MPRQRIGSLRVCHASPSSLRASHRSLCPQLEPRWNAAISATYPPSGSSATSMCQGTYPGIVREAISGGPHFADSNEVVGSGEAVRNSSVVDVELHPATPDLRY